MDKVIIEKIKECELLLIGLGEDMDLSRSEEVKQHMKRIKTEDTEGWMLPYIKRSLILEKQKEQIAIYDELAKKIKDKNYFVISLAMDGAVSASGLNQERVVEPCGGYEKLQCSEKCSAELYDLEEQKYYQIINYALNPKTEKPDIPLCPQCGKTLVFNNVECENYVEDGYLGKWQLYMKWLQGTVNRKVCILEIGTGLKYPSVIRWPFEKIAFFNQKADFIRVHERLYQTAEEIKDKSVGICQKPEEFLKELSKML